MGYLKIDRTEKYEKLESVNSINYTLFSSNLLTVKFKLNIFYKTAEVSIPQSHHVEYVVDSNRVVISINPKPFVVFEIKTQLESGNKKEIIFISEQFKERMVSKLKKLANLMIAYDDNEIDVLMVNQSGTHIHSEIAKPIRINTGNDFISIHPVFHEESCKVMIQFDTNQSLFCLTVREFIALYYVLCKTDYKTMTMDLLNYMNNCEIGLNRVDLRSEPGRDLQKEPDDSDYVSQRTTAYDMRDIEVVSTNDNGKNKKIKW